MVVVIYNRCCLWFFQSNIFFFLSAGLLLITVSLKVFGFGFFNSRSFLFVISLLTLFACQQNQIRNKIITSFVLLSIETVPVSIHYSCVFLSASLLQTITFFFTNTRTRNNPSETRT